MKKNNYSFVFFVLMALIPCSLFAGGGKPFEGVISYKITYPDNKFTEAQLANFPKLVTISIKGTKSRTEINAMGTQVTITDYADKTKVVLMDIMGQKYAIKTTAEQIEKENAKQSNVKITVTEETRDIAGYKCKKAIVTSEEDGVKSTFEVYFTNELGGKGIYFDDPLYKDIDGVMLEFSMKAPQFSMKFTATSVEKKSISAKDFEIPADYKLTTEEELKSKFGGGTGD
jgi:hypothetical protein